MPSVHPPGRAPGMCIKNSRLDPGTCQQEMRVRCKVSAAVGFGDSQVGQQEGKGLRGHGRAGGRRESSDYSRAMPCRVQVSWKKVITAFLVIGTLAFTLVGASQPTAGQTYVELDGRVQWIAGQKLTLLLAMVPSR